MDNDEKLDLEEIEKFIKVFNEDYNQLPENEKRQVFRNRISNSGSCGFAGAGRKQYLINTDTTSRYRVTIHVVMRINYQIVEERDEVIINEAGGQQYIGCTDGGLITGPDYERSVVGETII